MWWLLLLAVGANARSGEEPPPYAELTSKPYEYHGPRRDLAEPVDVTAVRIGLFAPAKGPRAQAGLSLRRGAELAVAEANAAGGYHGIPFALVHRSDDQIWGSAREVVELAYDEKVWAIVGAIGGQSTHVAQQVITKAQLPLISPASTDPSLTQINIPWMFRCLPDDEQIARLLATHVLRERGLTRVVAMATVGYDSRLRSAEFEKMAGRLGHPLILSLFYGQDFSQQLRLIAESDTQALVLFGQPQEVVPVLRGLRERGLAPAIFGGPGLATAALPELAGDLAEGITVVAPFDLWRDDPIVEGFRRGYAARYGDRPDVIASTAYDATQLVVAAIRAGGLNRARIRDALAAGEPFVGVSGVIRFDGSGGNVGAPVVAVIRDGRFVRF